ncbi:hypothetical protein DFH09DRAFT_1098296 [Mycena vulgaris]|nr:hypothetical protein DFH09DRAFT_1098296 [Mycena vulgaris]
MSDKTSVVCHSNGGQDEWRRARWGGTWSNENAPPSRWLMRTAGYRFTYVRGPLLSSGAGSPRYFKPRQFMTNGDAVSKTPRFLSPGARCDCYDVDETDKLPVAELGEEFGGAVAVFLRVELRYCGVVRLRVRARASRRRIKFIQIQAHLKGAEAASRILNGPASSPARNASPLPVASSHPRRDGVSARTEGERIWAAAQIHNLAATPNPSPARNEGRRPPQPAAFEMILMARNVQTEIWDIRAIARASPLALRGSSVRDLREIGAARSSCGSVPVVPVVGSGSGVLDWMSMMGGRWWWVREGRRQAEAVTRRAKGVDEGRGVPGESERAYRCTCLPRIGGSCPVGAATATPRDDLRGHEYTSRALSVKISAVQRQARALDTSGYILTATASQAFGDESEAGITARGARRCTELVYMLPGGYAGGCWTDADE